MHRRSLLTSVVLAICFTGCATFAPQETNELRQHGVSTPVIGKMEHGHVLSPGDVIELTRRGVPDNLIIRQIESAGVDYLLNQSNIRRMQAAHVSRPVMEALYIASQDFARRHYARAGLVHIYATDPYYYGGPFYYAPYAYYYPYGEVCATMGSRYRDGHRWH